MKNVPVHSRIIQSVYFSPVDGRLRICFKNGEERQFIGVAEHEVVSLCGAASPGQHYIDHIRKRFTRVAA